jgi:bifunctional non-homologous end joining protein LigD
VLLMPFAFIQPCLPCTVLLPPSGRGWLHEIKHAGHRVVVRRDGGSVRLFGQRGEDWTTRYSDLAKDSGSLRVKSCMLDGILVGGDENGEVVREDNLSYYVFDLIEVNGFDLRRDHIQERKRALAVLLGDACGIMRFSPHFEHEGPAVFHQACQMGFEGIVSKRLGSPYVSGRSTSWLLSRKLD